MSTRQKTDTIRGEELRIPLGGSVSLFLWPFRAVGGTGLGGVTFGVDVLVDGQQVEILRFDPHGTNKAGKIVGHWHAGLPDENVIGGYDALGPAKSSRPLAEWLTEIPDQEDWCAAQVQWRTQELLKEAGYGEAAKQIDPTLLREVGDKIKAHFREQDAAGLRAQAVDEGLVTA